MTQNFLESELLPYKLAGLLYAPAININIAKKIINKEYNKLTSMAFCLEDSIMDDALHNAESALAETLDFLRKNNLHNQELPLLFVRIRTPQHMEYIHNLLGENENILTGYILPKFDLSNASKYCKLIFKFNAERQKKLYVMPILESKMIAYKSTRLNILIAIKEIINEMRQYILNIRVGGNDFCNIYGLRRSVNQNIYDIGVIRDILVDIINVFASDYVVSGAVWEYFGQNPDDDWARGLKSELMLDKLNGFTGKTAIHPSQIPIIYESMKVSESDYNDALQILDWKSEKLGVSKSIDGSRMNEVKCHSKWAKRIKIMGDLYGIREELKI